MSNQGDNGDQLSSYAGSEAPGSAAVGKAAARLSFDHRKPHAIAPDLRLLSSPPKSLCLRWGAKCVFPISRENHYHAYIGNRSICRGAHADWPSRPIGMA